MLKILFNVYLVLAFFLLGPEALAKSLPMKKVKTTETVWMPVDAEEIEQLDEGIEAVEISSDQQGAVPLYKEVPAAAPTPAPIQVAKPPEVAMPVGWEQGPRVLVKKPEKGKEDQRPIIQVIYQNQPEGMPAQAIQIPPKPEKKPEVKPAETNEPEEKGDIYNFYFRS